MSSSLTSTPSGRRRTERGHNAEDETLSQIAKEAEARLAQKRAARIEAREIRMRELERQQREVDEKAGKDGDDKSSKVGTTLMNNNHLSLSSSISMLSRRSSDDSLSASEPSSRDMRESLSEIEEKYKRAMVQNAQLDNERTQLNYRVEQLKDSMEEQEDKLYRLKKDYKDKNQELENRKRLNISLQKKYEDSQEALRQRDELIQEQGLVMVAGNMAVDGDADSDDTDGYSGQRYTLLTQEAAQVLQSAGDGPLEVRLKNLAEEKQHLVDEVRRLQQDLDEERKNKDGGLNSSTSSNIENGVSDMMLIEMQRESSKQISDYKFKLQQAEQEIGSYQASITRLETQLQRYKATAEVLEKSEDEMRAEKRKLQRDLRAALDRIEEMQMTNQHLEKRMEKMRAARNALASQT